MTQEEKSIVLKTMDLLYNYLKGKIGDKDSETMKETLFDEFFEYNNGNKQYIFEQIKKGFEESGVLSPKTVDEAISTLEKILTDEDRDYLLENGAISMHHSLGRWIRNEWGLWTGSELKNELKKKGFEHPDDMSNYIIEEFIKYWNNRV